MRPSSGTLDESAPRLARWYGVPGTRFEYRIENLAESDGAEEHEQAAIAERLAKLGVTLARQAAASAEVGQWPSSTSTCLRER